MGSGPIPGKFSPRRDDVPRLVTAATETRAKPVGQVVDGANALSAFQPEAFQPEEPATPPRPRVTVSVPAIPASSTRQLVLWSLFVAVGLAVTFSAVALRPRTPAQPVSAPKAVVRPGQVTLETLPVGAEVLVNGQLRGLTPLTLPLDPGHHEVVLRRGTDERKIPLDITSGAQVTQRVEFAPASGGSARLSVVTEPAGARVLIDGDARGVSPVTLSDLPVGRHRISVTSAGGSAERTMTLEAGTTTSLVFSLPKAPTLGAGWLTVSSPFDVKILERGEVLGTSATSRIMIPAGSHDLEISNPSLGYSNRRRVEIEPGKNAVVLVEARAPLNVNARPWAEVTIDGSPVGVTPIANHVLPLGTHQILFHHPQLGDRRQEIVVTQQGPNRISVDMTTK